MCTDAIELTIVTDATFSEETKTTGIAAVLLDETGQPRLVCGKQIEASNIVEGELRAILFALEEIPDDGAKLLLQSDNKNAVDYLNGDAHTGQNEMRIVRKIQNRIESKHLTIRFEWQSRNSNAIADAIAAVSTRNENVRVLIL